MVTINHISQSNVNSQNELNFMAKAVLKYRAFSALMLMISFLQLLAFDSVLLNFLKKGLTKYRTAIYCTYKHV